MDQTQCEYLNFMHHPYLTFFKSLLCLLLLGGMLGSMSYAQETRQEKRSVRKEKKETRKRERMRWSISHTGLGYARSYDEMMSRRSYRGATLDLGFGFLHRRKDRISTFVSHNTGYFQQAPHGEASMFGGLFVMDYRYLWRVDNQSRPGLRVYAGGSVAGLANIRFNNALGNSSFSGEWATMLSPTTRLEYEVEKLPLLKGSSVLSAEMTLPLVSAVGRLPSWALPGFESFDTRIRPIGSFTRVQTELSILRRLGQDNPNLVKLSYSWELYGMPTSEIHRLRWASHMFGMTYYFRRGDLYAGQK